MPQFIKYGLQWGAEVTPLEIEFHFIRSGGYIEGNGQKFGLGLFQHYRNAQSICWPDEDHHRWSDLILKTVLDERLTVVQGSRDSGKTQGLTKYVLIDYFCFPENTLILMSSTDVRGLELRVWGNMKNLWQRAKDLHGDLISGNPVDSKHGIFTDALDDSGDIRDMRRGIICFVPETLVETPTGSKRIEDIKAGDEVVNACGVGRVKASGFRYAPRIVRVVLSDGRHIDCTPEHPFFTSRGWIKAVDLETCDRVFSAHETLRLLRQPTWAGIPESKALLNPLPELPAGEKLRSMRSDISAPKAKAINSKKLGKVLLHELRQSVGVREWDNRQEGEWALPEMQEAHEKSASQPDVLLGIMSEQCGYQKLQRMRRGFSIPSAFFHEAENQFLQRILQAEMGEQKHGEAGDFADQARIESGETIPEGSGGIESVHWEKAEAEYPASLRSGPGVSSDQAGCGTGWWSPQDNREENPRREAGQRIGTAWVDRVTFLKPDGDERFDRSKGGYRVHNLEVEGHPSYTANGVVVHNCIPVLDSEGNETKALEKFVGVKQKRRRLVADEAQFLPVTYLNILSNLDKGDFKSVFTGNPLGQKALDKVSEPEAGWDSHPEPKKTSTWRNRFDGVTINLVGTDSPNFDADRPKHYTYLVDQDDVKRVEKRFGKDSVEFYSQILGVRKSGLNARIVLTGEMCKANRAYEEAIWSGEETELAIGVDAGYGGDACETVLIEFGNDSQRRPVIKFHEPEVIPINLNDPSTPEDQIANQVRRMCELKRVPYRNVFFEAGMRATLAISLARILSNEVNAVNAGGSATTRPVSDDLFVDDDESGRGNKRLKRCDEHYSKFITEMWFSVRLLVECQQAREVPKSAVKEFSEREWIWARGTRYELESKEDFKKRCGYSPNKADAVAIAVEGARRLGFHIGRQLSKPSTEQEPNWLEVELAKQRREAKKRELSYS